MSKLKTYEKVLNQLNQNEMSTYLNHGLGSLSGSKGDHIFRLVHQDALSLHGLALESEIFCRVNDGAVLIGKMVK